QRIVVRPEVKEEEPRLLVQHVAVDGGNLDAIRPQGFNHRVHLIGGQHEVARDGGLAAAGRLKINPRRNAHRPGGTKLHSVFRDRIPPRHAELVDAAARFSFYADDLIEFAVSRSVSSAGAAVPDDAVSGVSLSASAARRVVANFSASPCPATCI